MKITLYSILDSAIILLTDRTHTLPNFLLNNSTDLESTFTAVKTGMNCWPSTIRGSRLDATRDCLQAALPLPDGSDAGNFHSGNLDDEFRLPVVKVYGSCMATVSLTQGTQDRNSWDGLSYVAN